VPHAEVAKERTQREMNLAQRGVMQRRQAQFPFRIPGKAGYTLSGNPKQAPLPT
jgi:hypothetical protein